MKLSKLFFVGLTLAGTFHLQAQKWGATESDSIRCWENYNNFGSLYQTNSFAEAYDYWIHTYENCPEATENIYIFAPKIIEAKIDAAASPEEKLKFQKLLLEQYDKRMKHFPEKKAYIMGQQALDMRKHFPDQLKEIYELFKASYELDNDIESPAVMNGYFITTVRLFNKKEIEIQDVLLTYDRISEAIEANNNRLNREIKLLNDKKEAGNIENKEERILARNEKILEGYDKLESNIEKMLSPLLSCDKLTRIYTREIFESNKTNPTWLRRSIRMFQKERTNDEGEPEDCTSEPLFFEMAEALYKIEPSATAARGMGGLSLKNGEYSTAVKYYQEAAGQEVDPKRQAEDYYRVAQAYLGMKNGAQAKSFALKAASLRKNWSAPYILIAQAYADAEGQCGNNTFENKAVYWAAMDKLNYARSIDPDAPTKRIDKLIAYYKTRLPDKTVTFNLNKVEGDKHTIGCWINETITVKFY